MWVFFREYFMMNFQRYAAMPFYPGPVSAHPDVLQALSRDYGPPRVIDEYAELYQSVCTDMKRLLGTSYDVVIGSGEAMLMLWGVLKSLLKEGDSVLTVGTGVFGDGFADMAESIGCRAFRISEPYDQTISEETLQKAADILGTYHPVLMTAVHCETPSGTLNPLDQLGKLKKDYHVPFFVVDAVASVGGTAVSADAWNADCVIGGSQKCLSCPPDMGFISVSDSAWDRIRSVNYTGYDALLPFRNAFGNVMEYPYTPNWWGVSSLSASVRALENEGLDNVFARHEHVAEMCRKGVEEIGIRLWPKDDAVNSPTVTACYIPEGWESQQWRKILASRGLFVGGSLGPLKDKVFRLGHMGTQANADTMKQAIEVMRDVLA